MILSKYKIVLVSIFAIIGIIYNTNCGSNSNKNENSTTNKNKNSKTKYKSNISDEKNTKNQDLKFQDKNIKGMVFIKGGTFTMGDEWGESKEKKR